MKLHLTKSLCAALVASVAFASQAMAATEATADQWDCYYLEPNGVYTLSAPHISTQGLRQIRREWQRGYD